jgi:hypothetical protein
MAKAKQQHTAESSRPQVDRFKDAARAAGCDESEAAFEEKLKAIAKAKPATPPAKKRNQRPR